MAVPLLNYAKLPSAIVHPTGLFISLPKKAGGRSRLDVEYVVDDRLYRFQGPEQLDATDLRVLQALVAQATLDTYPRVRRLRDGEEVDADEIVDKVSLCTSWTWFVASLGYTDGGSTRKLVLASLSRLSTVNVTVNEGGEEETEALVTGWKKDTVTGELVVELGKLLCSVLMCRNGFLALNLKDVRTLKSDAANLLHWRLLFINQDGERPVGLDKLCEYVYGQSKESTPASTTRRRRHTVREALRELRKIGWVASEGVKGVYRISRPKYAREEPWVDLA